MTKYCWFHVLLASAAFAQTAHAAPPPASRPLQGRTAIQPGSPLVQCTMTILDHHAACTVDMSLYADGPGGTGPACPAGVTASGPALLCEESFAAALSDARTYLASARIFGSIYQITVPAGQFDFSSEGRPLPLLHGAIDVSRVVPGGAACLEQAGLTWGKVVLSGDGCLVINGAGATATMLTTAPGFSGLYGKNVSHIMVENMTMAQPVVSSTQGTYVSQGVRTIDNVPYVTITIDFTPGFPTPLALFRRNCSFNHLGGCTPAGLPFISNDIYMRAYTNEAVPQLIQSIAGQETNAQLRWGYPTQDQVPIAAIPPSRSEPLTLPNRWTLTFSQPQVQRAVPSYFTGTTNGLPNLICIKLDDAEAFTFNDLPANGEDIILNNMVWTGAGRGVFRGIRGAIDGSVLGAQIFNSTIARGPPIGTAPQCLSTQSGGIQIGQPHDPAVFGSLVFGYASQATGDDSLAIFNDVGGLVGTHVTYPQSRILHSQIGNSFARDILLWNDRRRTHHNGNSPVLVDNATRHAITAAGNCDELVLGMGQCPVTYGTPWNQQ